MDLNLKGRVAVVTGGSLGIGRAIAEELAGEGVEVVIAARNAERLAAVAKEVGAGRPGRVLAVAGDMTDPADIARVMAEARVAFGRIDILVNNAGASPMGRIAETADETWQKSLNLKLMGYVRAARDVLNGAGAASSTSSAARATSRAPPIWRAGR